jgi:hypothetical protein
MWEHIWHFFSLLILTRSRTFLYLCEKMSLKRSRQIVFIYMRTHQWFLNETRFCIYLCEDTSGINSNLCENTSMILKWDQCLVFIYVRTNQWFSSETKVLSLFMWEHNNNYQVRSRSCFYLCENTSMIFKWGKCLVFIYVRTHQWFSSVAKALSFIYVRTHQWFSSEAKACFYLCENTSMILKWGQGLVFIYARTHQWFSSEAKALSLFTCTKCIWEHGLWQLVPVRYHTWLADVYVPVL